MYATNHARQQRAPACRSSAGGRSWSRARCAVRQSAPPPLAQTLETPAATAGNVNAWMLVPMRWLTFSKHLQAHRGYTSSAAISVLKPYYKQCAPCSAAGLAELCLGPGMRTQAAAPYKRCITAQGWRFSSAAATCIKLLPTQGRRAPAIETPSRRRRRSLASLSCHSPPACPDVSLPAITKATPVAELTFKSCGVARARAACSARACMSQAHPDRSCSQALHKAHLPHPVALVADACDGHQSSVHAASAARSHVFTRSWMLVMGMRSCAGHSCWHSNVHSAPATS